MNASVLYRINSLSFLANFSLTTSEDYLTINSEGTKTTYRFQDKGQYDLTYDLGQLLTGYTVSINDRGLLVITGSKEFSITEASHNVQLLLGIYHSQLPIHSSAKTIVSDSVPYTSYGNVLYLMARTDMVCSVNNQSGEEESLSIAYKTNEILYPSFPVMCKIPGQWSTISSAQLQQLEFRLVDFQFKPVKIHSPVYLTLEINSNVFQ